MDNYVVIVGEDYDQYCMYFSTYEQAKKAYDEVKPWVANTEVLLCEIKEQKELK